MEMPELSNPLPDHIEMSEKKLFSKKNVMTFLVIAIGLLVIPFSVKMLEKANIINIKATGDEITFVQGDNVDCSTGTCKAVGTKFQVLLKSPGEAIVATPTPTPIGATTPTPIINTTPTLPPDADGSGGNGTYGFYCSGTRTIYRNNSDNTRTLLCVCGTNISIVSCAGVLCRSAEAGGGYSQDAECYVP